MLEFRKMKSDDYAVCAPVMESEGFMCTESGFPTLYMWSDFYNTEICIKDGTVYFRTGHGDDVAGFIIGIERGVAHRIGDGSQIAVFIIGVADRQTVRIGDADDIAVFIYCNTPVSISVKGKTYIKMIILNQFTKLFYMC